MLTCLLAYQKGIPLARRVKWNAKSLRLYGRPVCGKAVNGPRSPGTRCQCTLPIASSAADVSEPLTAGGAVEHVVTKLGGNESLAPVMDSEWLLTSVLSDPSSSSTPSYRRQNTHNAEEWPSA